MRKNGNHQSVTAKTKALIIEFFTRRRRFDSSGATVFMVTLLKYVCIFSYFVLFYAGIHCSQNTEYRLGQTSNTIFWES